MIDAQRRSDSSVPFHEPKSLLEGQTLALKCLTHFTFDVRASSCRLRLLSTDEEEEVLAGVDEVSSSSSSELLLSAEVESDDESSSAFVTVALWLLSVESTDPTLMMLTLSASTVVRLERTASAKAP